MLRSPGRPNTRYREIVDRPFISAGDAWKYWKGTAEPATDLLAGLGIGPDRVLIPFHDPAVAEAFRKAGDRWLEDLAPVSWKAALAFKDLRLRGAVGAAGDEGRGR
jgi:hypothetical protein